jgi:hypothetical protein
MALAVLHGGFDNAIGADDAASFCRHVITRCRPFHLIKVDTVTGTILWLIRWILAANIIRKDAREMALTIKADEGDELSVHAFQLFEEQVVVRLELANHWFGDGGDFDWISLTPEQAYALGRALISAAGMVEPDGPAPLAKCN